MSSIPPNDLFDAIKSSQWKTRVEAYLSISEEINKGNLNDIPTFIPQIISDTNLAAFETALDVVLSFFKKDCSNKSLIISTLPQLINRGLIGRPKSKDVSKKIILLLCEKGFYSDVFDALYTATSSKNVKIVTEAIRCILVILTQCGPNVVGIKELLAKIKVWLGNKDKDVRKASLNIIHYFIGNIGNAMNEFISTLTTVQKKELEDYCKKNTPQHTSPTLHIEGVSNDFNAQNIVSILHISKVVPKNFQQLLRTPNWKEKQQVFTSIYNAIHNRVVEVDNSFLECLKMGLNDANTTVSAKAFVLFNYLLEKKTIPNAEPYLSIILSKLKSPSSAVTNSASVALLAISAEQITYNVLTTVYDFITTRHTTIYTVVCNWLEKVAKQLGEIKKTERLKFDNAMASILSICMDDPNVKIRDVATRTACEYVLGGGVNLTKKLQIKKERMQILMNLLNKNGKIISKPEPKIGINNKKIPTISSHQQTTTTKRPISPIPSTSAHNIPPRRPSDRFSPKPKEKALVPMEVVTRLTSRDWKEQQQAWENLNKVELSKTKMIKVVEAAVKAVTDHRKLLVKTVLTTIKNLSERNMMIGMTIDTLIDKLIIINGDSNATLKELAADCLVLFGEKVDNNLVMDYCGKTLQTTKSDQIKTSLLTIIKVLMYDVMGIKKALPGILQTLLDSNRNIRLQAEELLKSFAGSVGWDYINEKSHFSTNIKKIVAKLTKENQPKENQPKRRSFVDNLSINLSTGDRNEKGIQQTDVDMDVDNIVDDEECIRSILLDYEEIDTKNQQQTKFQKSIDIPIKLLQGKLSADSIKKFISATELVFYGSIVRLMVSGSHTSTNKAISVLQTQILENKFEEPSILSKAITIILNWGKILLPLDLCSQEYFVLLSTILKKVYSRGIQFELPLDLVSEMLTLFEKYTVAVSTLFVLFIENEKTIKPLLDELWEAYLDSTESKNEFSDKLQTMLFSLFQQSIKIALSSGALEDSDIKMLFNNIYQTQNGVNDYDRIILLSLLYTKGKESVFVGVNISQDEKDYIITTSRFYTKQNQRGQVDKRKYVEDVQNIFEHQPITVSNIQTHEQGNSHLERNVPLIVPSNIEFEPSIHQASTSSDQCDIKRTYQNQMNEDIESGASFSEFLMKNPQPNQDEDDDNAIEEDNNDFVPNEGPTVIINENENILSPVKSKDIPHVNNDIIEETRDIPNPLNKTPPKKNVISISPLTMSFANKIHNQPEPSEHEEQEPVIMKENEDIVDYMNRNKYGEIDSVSDAATDESLTNPQSSSSSIPLPKMPIKIHQPTLSTDSNLVLSPMPDTKRYPKLNLSFGTDALDDDLNSLSHTKQNSVSSRLTGDDWNWNGFIAKSDD